MQRLPIAQLTQFPVDYQMPGSAMLALVHARRQVDFGRVVLFRHDWLLAVVLPGSEVVDTSSPYARRPKGRS